MGVCLSVCGEMSSYKLIMGVNYLIFALGLVMVILGIVMLTQFSDEAFFSEQVYGLEIVFGLLTFGMVFLACTGAAEPQEKPNYLFCYWCLVSVLLIGNVVGLYYLKTFRDGLDRLNNNGGDQSLLDVVQISAAKELQDFILSTYTTCCTGCDTAECSATFDESERNGNKTFCDSVIAKSEFNQTSADLAAGQCFLALPCLASDLNLQQQLKGASDGLGIGCYTSLDVIPGFSIGSDTCKVFESLDNVVGAVASGHCGKGDPIDYVNDVVSYFNGHYLRIAVPWGFLIALLAVAWSASCCMILFHSAGRDVKLH